MISSKAVKTILRYVFLCLCEQGFSELIEIRRKERNFLVMQWNVS